MDSLQQIALAVPPIDETFNPDSTPETAEQYLQHVIYERTMKIPQIVSNHQKKPAAVNVTWANLTEIDIFHTAPLALLPTREWIKFQRDDFSKVQNQINNLRKLDYYSINLPTLPPDDTTIQSWYEFCRNHRPLLKIMIQIDQGLLEVLLNFQLEWLSHDSLNLLSSHSWLGEWIYASLACLHTPLDPDLHSLIRDIARQCIRIRNQFTEYEIDKVVPLNLIICIISNNFYQTDLGFNAIQK